MTRQSSKLNMLAIYIEPTPYILDLIRVMRELHPELRLRVLFISGDVSQQWGELPVVEELELLSAGRVSSLFRILQEIRGGDFDWLHLAGWGHPLLMAALLLGALFGRRISMESDTQLPFEQGHWKRGIKHMFYPALFSLADLLLPGGTRQKAYFRHYGVPEAKIRIAQMTVDVDRIIEISCQVREQKDAIRDSLGLSRECTVFIFVGRLEPYKGINLLLQAFGRLELPDIQLLIVGDGSCRALVEAAAASDRRICYEGRRDFSGVVEALAISDVAIVPSFLDQWGLFVNEAMAASLPVVTTERVGCVDDLVQDRVTGIIFPAGDVGELVTTMRSLAADGMLRDRMGRAGRRLISQWRLEDEVGIIVSAWRGQACS